MKKYIRYRCVFILTICMMLALVNIKTSMAETTQNVLSKSETEIDNKSTAVSIALDVSGSMKNTDSIRMSFEMINMVIDYCDNNDFINITAYNDQIVYSSGLKELKDDNVKTNLKKQIKQLAYEGYTDNGLGLLTATKAISDSKKKFDKSFVILISDGDTCLSENIKDRTIQDSDKDISEASRLAIENDIAINALELTKQYTQDTSKFSVATAATKGTTTVVSDMPQYVQVFFSLFFKEYNDAVIEWEISDTNEALNRKSLKLDRSKNIEQFSIIVTTKQIEDFDIIEKTKNVDYIKGDLYTIISMGEEGKDDITALFSLKESSTVIYGNAKLKKEVVQESEPTQEPTVKPTAQPTIKPTIKPTQEPKVQPMQEVQKEDDNTRTYIIIAVICFIVLLTIIICVLIVKKILFNNKKVLKLNGVLEATFIDLKSKNESKDIRWDLSNYSDVGVTLDELFRSINFVESLQDMDKICFYPSEKDGQIILVHCIEGGIFIGEDNAKPNKPHKIYNGTSIYVSFADNASEIQLQYKTN